MPDGLPLRPGDPPELGGHRLLRRLGEGNQGIVFLGRGPSGEQVAIKLLHARMAGDPGARERFMRELSAAKKVARFCTAQVLDADVAGDHPYIVSEYVEGRSLRSHIIAEGPRTDGALERLAIGTLTALAAIHRAGIVHRDFTPHNVLLGTDGPRVIDFGIARALGATGNQESNRAGTPSYMAPEQITDGEIGPPADMFAWGSTILFAATGRPPFGNEAVHAVMQRIVHDEPDVSALPEPLRSVVAACLAKDPAQRPTAQQAQAGLLGHEATESLMPPPAFGATAPPAQPSGSQTPASRAAATQAPAEHADPGDGPLSSPLPAPPVPGTPAPAARTSGAPAPAAHTPGRPAPAAHGPGAAARPAAPAPSDAKMAASRPPASGRPSAAPPHAAESTTAEPSTPEPSHGPPPNTPASGERAASGRPPAIRPADPASRSAGPARPPAAPRRSTSTTAWASTPKPPHGPPPGPTERAVAAFPVVSPAEPARGPEGPAGAGEPPAEVSAPKAPHVAGEQAAAVRFPAVSAGSAEGSARAPAATSAPGGASSGESGASGAQRLRSSDGAGSGRSRARPALTPAAAAVVERRRPRVGWAVLAGAAVIVAGAVVAVPLWPDGGDAATSPKVRVAAATPATPASPTPRAPVSDQPQLNGVRSGVPKPTPKHSKHPAKGCRDYDRPYGVTHAGSAVLTVSVCRGAYTGTVTFTDTVPKDGWDICLQLRGHITGTPATYISTILSSRDGRVRAFDNGPKARFGARTKRTEDSVTVKVGRCRGSGIQTSWQTQQQLAAG